MPGCVETNLDDPENSFGKSCAFLLVPARICGFIAPSFAFLRILSTRPLSGYTCLSAGLQFCTAFGCGFCRFLGSKGFQHPTRARTDCYVAGVLFVIYGVSRSLGRLLGMSRVLL